MPKTKSLIRNDEYFKGIACEALDLLIKTYPSSSRPGVLMAYLECLTDKVLETMLLDKNLHDFVLTQVKAELEDRKEARQDG